MNTQATRSLSGVVEVDGLRHRWSLRHEAVWTRGEGWTGLTIVISLDEERTREAVLEFPLLPGHRLRRPKVLPAYVQAAIRAALKAGWDPNSRGKPALYVLEPGDVPV